MADVKVSALTALTGADLANGDQFLVTDVGSPNVSKSITADELAQGSQFTSRYIGKTNDTIFWQVGSATITSGTPTFGRWASSYLWGGVLFDASAAEAISFGGVLPHYWSTFDIKLWWANDSTGSGDVVWAVRYKFAANGTDAGTSPTTLTSTTATAGLNNVIVVSTAHSAVLNTSGNLLFLSVERTATDAADTLGNDAALIGVELVRVS
jgi:hypothetical protein